jgi:glycosyltransferase involved in cell wall biosynthesis
MRTRLVYVLPRYDPDSSEHTYHIYGFLEAVAEHLDVWLIVERAQGRPSFHGLKVYLQRVTLPLLSKIELLAVMLWARLHGYKRFYTHYSMSAGILSGLVTRVLGGVSYYWNCGQVMDFVPERVRSVVGLRSTVRNQLLLGTALHIVHHLVTCNPTMALYYSKGYKLPLTRIRVMPNWVDLDRFAALPKKQALRQELDWPQNKRVVLFLHRLSERKGAHHIVPIAQHMVEDYPQLAKSLLFVVVGGGPYRENLEREIHEAGLGDHFRLTGAVPNREVPKYYAAADVYMMPSRMEGFGRTLLEAMAAGCPIVATDVGGVKDVLTPEQRRFLVARDDPRAMGVALGRLLADKSLSDELARVGHAHLQNYSQVKVAQRFVTLVSQ